jgi:hypothetical protein
MAIDQIKLNELLDDEALFMQNSFLCNLSELISDLINNNSLNCDIAIGKELKLSIGDNDLYDIIKTVINKSKTLLPKGWNLSYDNIKLSLVNGVIDEKLISGNAFAFIYLDKQELKSKLGARDAEYLIKNLPVYTDPSNNNIELRVESLNDAININDKLADLDLKDCIIDESGYYVN